MGLDQYWYREQYVPKYAENGNDEFTTITGKVIPTENLGFGGSRTTTDMIGYLRKANAVHGWIVRNLAGGKDECQKIYMDEMDVQRLLADIAVALDTGEGMDPAPGFFFGSQEKDEWWRSDLERAAAICNWILEDMKNEGAYYYYESSW